MANKLSPALVLHRLLPLVLRSRLLPRARDREAARGPAAWREASCGHWRACCFWRAQQVSERVAPSRGETETGLPLVVSARECVQAVHAFCAACVWCVMLFLYFLYPLVPPSGSPASQATAFTIRVGRPAARQRSHVASMQPMVAYTRSTLVLPPCPACRATGAARSGPPAGATWRRPERTARLPMLRRQPPLARWPPLLAT